MQPQGTLRAYVYRYTEWVYWGRPTYLPVIEMPYVSAATQISDCLNVIPLSLAHALLSL